MNGVSAGTIEGGWEFVIAAYALSALVFAGSLLSVHLRYRAECKRVERDARRDSEIDS